MNTDKPTPPDSLSAAHGAAPCVETKKPRIILTFLAQQYGLTVEDLMRRNNCNREQIIVEEAPNMITEPPKNP